MDINIYPTILAIGEMSIFALLIFHCWSLRGKRITFTFFIFSFICMAWKVIGVTPKRPPNIPQMASHHYQLLFFPQQASLLGEFIAIVGWIIVFYLSWRLAEKIIENIPYYKNRIFPVLFFSGLAAIGFSYAIEATAIAAKWWAWKYEYKEIAASSFLVGTVPFYALTAWFDTTVHLLAAYFLIECTRFRKYWWKFIFLFIPQCSYRFEIMGLRVYEELVMITFLSFFSFFNKLPFMYGNIDLVSPVRRGKNIAGYLLKREPHMILILTASILAYVLFIDMFVIQQPVLIISKLPLGIMLLLAGKRIKTAYFLALGILFLAFFIKSRPLLITLFPAAIFLVFEGKARFTQSRGTRQ
ncbi:MAG: hypothetical protein JXD21_00580 [Candidatus Omnitrophica bacterium]|nr:hypothetical protein [Candidatus Omnitrophota bacterium]